MFKQFLQALFDTFVATLQLTSMEKWYFQNFIKKLTVVLSTLHLNCIVHASIFNFTRLIKLLISHNIELLVNMKMHLSIWEMNFVYLLLILDCIFLLLLLYKNRKFGGDGRRNDCVRNHSLYYFLPKTYVVDIQKNRLIETILLNTQNICFKVFKRTVSLRRFF